MKITALCLLAFTLNSASHGLLDLTIGDLNPTAIVNGAIFTISETGSGTGTFKSFLRVQNNVVERGMNADAITNSDSNDEKTDNTSTHDVLFSQVPVNNLSNSDFGSVSGFVPGAYFEIRMDMNEDQNESPQDVVVTELQVWASPTQITNPFNFYAPGQGQSRIDNGHPDAVTTDGQGNPVNLGTRFWDLDSGGDDAQIRVTQSNSGSGASDLIFYIPVTETLASIGATASWFFTLYVELTDTNSAGFEEFAVIDLTKTFTGVKFVPGGVPLSTQIPEASCTPLLLLLCGWAGMRLRR